VTVVVADNFNTLTAGTALNGRTPSTSAGFNWTVRNGTNIKGATGGGSLHCGADGGGNPDQCAVNTGVVDQKVTATILSAGDNEGHIMARGSAGGSAPNCYLYRFRTTTNIRQVRRRDAGVMTTLDFANMPSNTAAGDVMALEVSGTGATVTIKTYRNGVQVGSDVTDSSASRKTSGTFAGLESVGGAPNYDDFEVDDLVVGGGTGVSFDAPSVLLQLDAYAGLIAAGKSIAADAILLQITANDSQGAAGKSVNADAASITATANDGTAAGGTSVFADSASLTFTANEPTVACGVSVTTDSVLLVITAYAPSTGSGVNVTAAAIALAITANDGTVAAGKSINAPATTLTTTANDAAVRTGASVTADAAQITTTAHSVTVYCNNILADAVLLTITAHDASVFAQLTPPPPSQGIIYPWRFGVRR
jgi:hypothetical protein